MMDPGTSLGLRQHPDKVERAGPYISMMMTLLGLISGPSWPVGLFGLVWDAKELVV